MAVIATNEWLEKDIANPSKMCHSAMPAVEDSEDFYNYLKGFGMYQSVDKAQLTYEKLQEQNVWSKMDSYYQLYRTKWKGPKVDIYIFPLNEDSSYFKQLGRAGVAMDKKIFLFVSPIDDEKYWESLFIHEYHHAARMIRMKQNHEDYTLLDSLVFEGLAEQTVLLYCGDKYTMGWEKKYSDRILQYYWERYYRPNLEMKKKDPFHDDLLYGRRGIPQMLGYALGDRLMKGFVDNNKLTVTKSLHISSTDLLNNNRFLE
ncbi:DUF2268 domain-containing protein [Bacillus sp. FSL K6-3431]|uniref:DUF2268 domain-containing protein n=1 Tax=Bacillus sp. FSL K6-3431 TaxID=2921500 RepID=UPI0030F771A8